jgi:3-hydroxybutyryl-CoA dehydrogenase
LQLRRIGVVGAGAMGAGIAQLLAVNGFRVKLFDVAEGAAARAIDRIDADLKALVGRNKLADDKAREALERTAPASALEDFGDADLVIEAIVEDLSKKRDLFASLERSVAPGALLASNTSSLPIGAIASTLSAPERFAGMHFFNPAPVMRLVEIIPGPDTAPATVERLRQLAERLGRTPIEVKDAPGFVVNFGGRAYQTEALATVHESVATPAMVDAVMRDCCGFRMGPFELMDFTGIDVGFPVTQFVHRSSFGDPRLRSTPLHQYLYECGRFGRKSGVGFYDYREAGGSREQRHAAAAEPASRVALAEDNAVLAALVAEAGGVVADDDGDVPILGSPVGEDCTDYCVRLGLDARRTCAVDTIFHAQKRLTAMAAPGHDAATVGAAVALLAQARPVTFIRDSAGFIAQRIVAMIANLGCEMAQTGLATPEDIDKAMRLGLNYPRGPIEFADHVGTERLLSLLQNMQRISGDDRYRPSLWLRRRALLGLSAAVAI